jgi:hypothetical protein
MSLVSGNVTSGDPSNLRNGDAVCTDSVIRVNPSVNARWATPDLSIAAWYPNCNDDETICPAPPVPGGSVNTNRNIRWLGAAVFDDHDSYSDGGFPYSRSRERYDELSVFHNQPMTYVSDDDTYANMRGEANVFCKGNLIVSDGESGTGMSPSATRNVDITLRTEGLHSIRTRIADAACIAVAVKYPTEYSSSGATDFFMMSYYTSNQPTIPEARTTKTLTVQSADTCMMRDLSFEQIQIDPDRQVVRVTMHNDGDPIRVTGVTASSPLYTASPFPGYACGALEESMPDFDCPDNNGFMGRGISGMNNGDLYVLLVRSPGAPDTVSLTFDAETVSTTCGRRECNHAIELFWESADGGAGCQITNSTLIIGTNEVAQFEVDCTDESGAPVTCTGNNWYWEGLSGDFISRTNAGAMAYTTSSAGSTGFLRYRSGSMICSSNITVRRPQYTCSFSPLGVTLGLSATKDFNLTSYISGFRRDPNDVDYARIDGLLGGLSAENIRGVVYNAPEIETSGRLRAFSQFSSAPDPILGSVCFADVDVINGSTVIDVVINETNETDDDDDHGEGSSQYCTIGGSGPLNVYPGYSGWLSIRCGSDANETCSEVSWSTEGNITLTSSTTEGTYIHIVGPPEGTGRINAAVDGEPTHTCYKPFIIGRPECWEVS